MEVNNVKLIHKIACSLLVLLLLCTVARLDVSADNSISLIKEIQLPEFINITTNTTCSGHRFFIQASACEDGSYLITTLQIDDENPSSKETFEKVFIDIYDSTGEFIEELSFTTTFDFAVEMTTTTVNIIFYDFVVSYNYATKECSCFEISDATNTFHALRKEKFVSGEWEYRCTKSPFMGYKTLTRNNGKCEQVLIDFPGLIGVTNKFYIGGIIGFTIFAICLILIIRKKRALNNADNS